MFRLLRSFLISIQFLFTYSAYGQLGPGDIAFVGFNADGDDDFAIVVLVDVTNEVVYFSDASIGAISGATEGTLKWESGPTTIPVGTVVVFTDAKNGNSVSVGSLSEPDLGFDLSGSGDGILAFQGINENTPSTFLAGFQNGTGNFGSLSGTGLVLDSTAITITKLNASDDGAIYVGSRNSELDFHDYINLIRNSDNWTTNQNDGELIFPFLNTTSFSLFTCFEVPKPCVFDISLCFEGQHSSEIIPLVSDTSVLEEDFETEGLGMRYFLDRDAFTTIGDTSLSSGNQGKSFLTRTDGSNIRSTSLMYDSIRGSFWFGAADLNKNSTILPSTAELTFDTKGIKGLCDLQFSVYLAEDDVSSGGTNHWNREDYVHFDYSIDKGAYQNLLHIENDGGIGGSEPFVDTNFDGDGEGVEVTDTFSRFAAEITGLGDSITIRISMFLDAGDEDIAIDSIRVWGTPSKYNYYDGDPSSGGTVLASMVSSYDPVITLASSPQYIWVQSICEGCPSLAEEVIVAVHPPGDVGIACFDEVNISLNGDCRFDDIRSDAFYAGGLAPIFFNLNLKTESGDSVSQDSLHLFLNRKLIYELIDTCTQNKCWGYLNLEDKLMPKAKLCPCDILNAGSATVAPDSCTYYCLDSIYFHDPIFVDNCEFGIYADSTNINLEVDSLEIGCDTMRIQRIWTYKNPDYASQEEVICRQNYFVLPIPRDSLKWPPNKIDLSCDKVSLTAPPSELIEKFSKDYASPYIINNVNDTINLLDSNHLCNLAIFRQDQYIDQCANGIKILRNWKILDWCTNAYYDSLLIVNVQDKDAPDFGVVSANIQVIGTNDVIVGGDTISIDSIDVDVEIDFDKLFQVIEIRNPWSCNTDFEVPIFENLKDNCSAQQYIRLSSEVNSEEAYFDPDYPRIVRNIPVGSTSIIFTATDECDNSSTHTLSVTVLDKAQPIAICADTLIVTLTEDSDIWDGGIAQVPVESFNLNSHDGCGDISLILARRLDGKFICGNGSLTSISTEYIDFCCEDLDAAIPVSVTIFDESGNTQECISYVKIENKNESFIVCQDVTLGCDDPVAPELVGGPQVYGICAAPELAYTDEYNVDDLCYEGYIERTWTVVGTDVQCVQTISISKDDDNSSGFNPLSIKWPLHNTGENWAKFVARIADDDAHDTDFNMTDIIIRDYNEHDQCEAFQFHGTIKSARAGSVRAVPYTDFLGDKDEIFEKSTAAERNAFLATCDMNDLFYCFMGEVDEPTWTDPTCGLLGVTYADETFKFSDGVCIKVLRRWAVIDWCVYEPNEDDADYPGYDNDAYVLVKDICESEAYFKYDFDSDAALYRDGYYTWTQEIKIADNEQPVIVAGDDVTVEVGGESKSDAGDCAGEGTVTATGYDLCDMTEVTGAALVWSATVFQVDADHNAIGGRTVADVEVVDGVASVTVEGSAGEYYQVKWKLTDGCNNPSEFEVDGSTAISMVHFADTKAPVIVCYEDLSTHAMSTDGTSVIWAKDYIKSTLDCKGADLIYGFKAPDGSYVPSLTVTCDDFANGLADTWESRVYVSDRDNEAWCKIRLNFTDIENVCTEVSLEDSIIISGSVQTEVGDMIESAEITMKSQTVMTTVDGTYSFDDGVLGSSYELNVKKEDDYANGVSSLDLVLIQKHILGLQFLDSPFKVIAADINSDENISAIDLVELRKLILGMYSELPNNASWRFAEESQAFEDTLNPFPFVENINIDFLTEDRTNENFIGVKVGDVSGNAIANSLIAQGRSNGSITLRANDGRFDAGELVRVKISSDEFIDMSAFQFTLNVSGLEFAGVQSGAITMTEGNIAVHEVDAASDKWALTAAWFDVNARTASDPLKEHQETLFVLEFRAVSETTLSNSLSIGSSITDARAYTAEADQLDIVLSFNTGVEKSSETIDNQGVGGFELYQNTPNPFESVTTIGFQLAEAGPATMTVFDVTGKVVNVLKGQYARGYNQISLKKSDLGSSGVLYYQLSNGGFTQVRRMLLLKI